MATRLVGCFLFLYLMEAWFLDLLTDGSTCTAAAQVSGSLPVSPPIYKTMGRESITRAPPAKARTEPALET